MISCAPQATANIAASLRQAVETGDFQAAVSLAEPYREMIARALRTAPSEDERAVIARETIAFLEERLHMARVLRAHIASRLAAASRARSYQEPSAEENSWLLEG